METHVIRSLASSELREASSNIEKAAFLVAKLGFPTNVVAQVCSLNRCSIQRAVKAYKNGRELGINGRPKTLSKDEEAELKRVIEKRVLEHRSPSKSEVAAEVCVLFLRHSELL